MNISLGTEDLLDDISDRDILLYCHKRNLVNEDTVRSFLGIGSDDVIPDMSWNTDVYIDSDDVLNNMYDGDITDYLEDRGYMVMTMGEYESMNSVPDYLSDRVSFVNYMKNVINRYFESCRDRSDFKEIVCRMADDYLYI